MVIFLFWIEAMSTWVLGMDLAIKIMPWALFVLTDAVQMVASLAAPDIMSSGDRS
jgi:hypothetical protein